MQTLDHGENPRGVFYALLFALTVLVINVFMHQHRNEEGSNDGKAIDKSLLIGKCLDILDMAELIFTSTGCILKYGIGWQASFYFALVVAAVLTCVYYGLEGLKKHGMPKKKDYVATILGLLFSNLFFIVVRCKVMYTQNRASSGLIFVAKEVFSIVIGGLNVKAWYKRKDSVFKTVNTVVNFYRD